MIVFFDLDGVVRAEFVSRNTKVNSEYYEGWNFNSGNYLFTTDTK